MNLSSRSSLFLLALSILLSLCLLNSCRSKPDFSTELSILDNTNLSLDSALADYNKFLSSDSSAIAAASKEIAGSIREIKNFLPSDTLDKDMAIFLYELSNVKASLDSFSRNHDFYCRQSDISRKQIANLTKDLQNGLIAQNIAKEYTVTEVAAARKILAGLDKMTYQSKADLRKLDSLKLRIRTMTDSLRPK